MSPDYGWVAEHPARLELWVSAYSDGFDAGERSRPTDDEIQAWAEEIRDSAWRDGYRVGRGELEHRDHVRAAIKAPGMAERLRHGYIPRRAS